MALIEEIRANQPNDDNVQKLCRIYNHALKYDPLMYLELQKNRGRISNISNLYVIKKLLEIMVQDPTDKSSEHSLKYRDNKGMRIKTQDESNDDREE